MVMIKRPTKMFAGVQVCEECVGVNCGRSEFRETQRARDLPLVNIMVRLRKIIVSGKAKNCNGQSASVSIRIDVPLYNSPSQG